MAGSATEPGSSTATAARSRTTVTTTCLRAAFNSIGTISFYDDFVVQAGTSLGYSSDTSAPLGPGIVTGGPADVPRMTSDFVGERTFWSADLQVTYRGWALTGEYLRADW